MRLERNIEPCRNIKHTMKEEFIYQAILSTLAHEATDEEQAAVDCWLAESEANREEYERLKELYEKSTTPRKPKTFDIEKAWEQVAGQTIHKKKKKNIAWKSWVSYAAFWAVAIGLSMFLWVEFFHKESNMQDFKAYQEPTLILDNGEQINLSKESFSRKHHEALMKNKADELLSYQSESAESGQASVYNRLIIPRGKTYQLILEDSTRIWVNSETELQYPNRFEADQRVVKLTGEAYFEVYPEENRPFLVETNGLTVRVLGTSFNVNAYQGDDCNSATLVEGSVVVRTNNGKEQVMVPSEHVSFNLKKGQMTVEKVDTDLYTSWIHGVCIFKNKPLSEIMETLQRWYDFTVVYENETLKHTRFSLTADRKTDIDKLMEVINATSDVKLERKEKIMYVTKQRRIR